MLLIGLLPLACLATHRDDTTHGGLGLLMSISNKEDASQTLATS